MTTNVALIREAQSLEPSAYIALYTLDASPIGGGILRFCSSMETNGEAVGFGNVKYFPLNFSAEGFEWNGDGHMPRPKITLAVGDKTDSLPSKLLDLAVGYRGGQGAVLHRLRTLERYLDGHVEGGRNIAWPPDMFIVDRLLNLSKKAIAWEMITPMEQPNLKLPGRQALRDTCTHIYRRWNAETNKFEYDQSSMSCPYAAAACYDKSGAACANKDDACGRCLKDCVLRFGKGKPLPYSGFPGLARTRV